MPKARSPRVEIEPHIYKALVAESLLQDTSPKVLIAEWILEHLSPKAQEFLDLGANDTIISSPLSSKGHMDHDPMIPRSQDSRAKKRRLSKDLAAQARIKEMINQNPRPSLAAIGREVGYSKSTVQGFVEKLESTEEVKPISSAESELTGSLS